MPTIVKQGEEYYETQELTHYEGLAETRAEIAAFSTDYAVGSVLVCSADWSVWVLGDSSGSKAWLEVV